MRYARTTRFWNALHPVLMDIMDTMGGARAEP